MEKLRAQNNKNFQDWGEFSKLGELPELVELGALNNPLHLKHKEEGDWVERVAKTCPVLKKLDGNPVLRDE